MNVNRPKRAVQVKIASEILRTYMAAVLRPQFRFLQPISLVILMLSGEYAPVSSTAESPTRPCTCKLTKVAFVLREGVLTLPPSMPGVSNLERIDLTRT